MKPSVATHKLFGRRDIVRATKRLAPDAARLVDGSVPGRMPRIEVTVTTTRGMAELAAAADVALAGGVVDSRTRSRAERDARRTARESAGRAAALPDGGVLILLNAEQHHSADEVAVTLVHELTHAMQFSRRGVRERMTGHLRDALGIARQTRRAQREHLRLLAQEEAEAYAAEHLATQLTSAAAA
ncbi:hypothetical protein [Streptomyces sp. GC420]|uniref:hypothetical protein n=1 Tax=Streptomyces sp. GC420 TaxID=2697568 RepID=UPI0014152100|nr:hypothetical protein [Streptomyces sp. GC420]NBM18799.1 hypothetical protein [Streptomyces sp. GC420]